MSRLENKVPVFVEFEIGSRVEQNFLDAEIEGLPDTQIILADGKRVSLPTEQLVFEDSSNGMAQVGIGGMSFEGISPDGFVLYRVKDLVAPEYCSPHFSGKLVLDTDSVKRFVVNGHQVWPMTSSN